MPMKNPNHPGDIIRGYLEELGVNVTDGGDGDILTIVQALSVVAGADLGRLLIGGALRVPINRRAHLEALLAGRASTG